MFIVLALLLGLVLTIYGFMMIIVSDSKEEVSDNGFIAKEGTAVVSPNVKRYENLIRRYAEQNGIESYTFLIMALMQQESGGRGQDPMQASESLCGYIGCITSPQKSIEQGVKVFAQRLKQANGDIKLMLQSYNFGPGFINYAKKHNGGNYSKELAIEFSKYMMTKVSDPWNYTCIRKEARPYGACFGDIVRP